MPPEILASVVNSAIGCVIGIFVTLLGFRIVGKKPGEDVDADKWHEKWGRLFKIAGPMIVIASVFVATSRIARG